MLQLHWHPSKVEQPSSSLLVFMPYLQHIFSAMGADKTHFKRLLLGVQEEVIFLYECCVVQGHIKHWIGLACNWVGWVCMEQAHQRPHGFWEARTKLKCFDHQQPTHLSTTANKQQLVPNINFRGLGFTIYRDLWPKQTRRPCLATKREVMSRWWTNTSTTLATRECRGPKLHQLLQLNKDFKIRQ